MPEYAGLQPLEPGTRLESLLGQRAAKALVMVQSLGLASTRVQGSHQQSPGRLAQRCTRGQYLRRADCARDVTLPQQDRRQQFPRLLQQGVEPASRADREILIGDVLERLPPPQAEGFDERVMSLGQQALADRGPSAVDGIPEDRGVARFTAHLEGVPGGPSATRIDEGPLRVGSSTDRRRLMCARTEDTAPGGGSCLHRHVISLDVVTERPSAMSSRASSTLR
ncbi:hypothetical protein RKD37_002749 [Streptomyces ambofaciens]